MSVLPWILGNSRADHRVNPEARQDNLPASDPITECSTWRGRNPSQRVPNHLAFAHLQAAQKEVFLARGEGCHFPSSWDLHLTQSSEDSLKQSKMTVRLRKESLSHHGRRRHTSGSPAA